MTFFFLTSYFEKDTIFLSFIALRATKLIVVTLEVAETVNSSTYITIVVHEQKVLDQSDQNS